MCLYPFQLKIPLILILNLFILNNILLNCNLVLGDFFDTILLLHHPILNEISLLANLLNLLILVPHILLLLLFNFLSDHEFIYFVGLINLKKDARLLVDKFPLLLGLQLHLVCSCVQKHLGLTNLLTGHPDILLYL